MFSVIKGIETLPNLKPLNSVPTLPMDFKAIHYLVPADFSKRTSHTRPSLFGITWATPATWACSKFPGSTVLSGFSLGVFSWVQNSLRSTLHLTTPPWPFRVSFSKFLPRKVFYDCLDEITLTCYMFSWYPALYLRHSGN